ncbi:MAG: HD domain-containing protein [Gammaproteobacteria bacterium]|nr:HD domain-containing protein [Gammaproteobacteria bacterium]
MQYSDELYGRIEIAEPVLQDLIASDALRRIKAVSQHGITALLGITPPFSRFDHSVGALLLVRRLGASIEEQIAALLHDVSHTAFSHVIDFVFDDHGGQSYHEEKKAEIVAHSDIPAILARHDMDWREFMDENQFSLLEQPSPDLCADRLDYFLRDLEFLKLAKRDEIYEAIESLEVAEGKITVNNLGVARWMAYTFIETDRTSWSNFREVGLYQLTAEAIKAAIRHEIISEADLWNSDDILWRKLRSADHPEVRDWVRLITPGTRFIWSEAKPLFRISTKVRSIDPMVSDAEGIMPLSKRDSTFAHYRSEYLSSKQGQWPMMVVNGKEVIS